MERVVNQSLKWYLETNDLLAPEQAGFRQFRATEDQTTYLAQEIEDAFQETPVLPGLIYNAHSTGCGWAHHQADEERSCQQHAQMDPVISI